jgi:hypothetical protein
MAFPFSACCANADTLQPIAIANGSAKSLMLSTLPLAVCTALEATVVSRRLHSLTLVVSAIAIFRRYHHHYRRVAAFQVVNAALLLTVVEG